MGDIILKPIDMGNSYPQQSNQNTPQGIDLFINQLNILEGFKTRNKNLHWGAKNDPIHLRLDQFYEVLVDYQDSIAEKSMGIYGKIAPNIINGILPLASDPLSFLSELSSKTFEFYHNICGNDTYCGIKAEIEVFIGHLNNYNLLFKYALEC